MWYIKDVLNNSFGLFHRSNRIDFLGVSTKGNDVGSKIVLSKKFLFLFGGIYYEDRYS